MNANTIGMLIIMIIYLGAMVLIGILFSRKNNDTSDFYLGGRNDLCRLSLLQEQ